MIASFIPQNAVLKSRLSSLQEKYTFKPGVNLLVGANGCGKSTLMNALRRQSAESGAGIRELVDSAIKYCFFFDFEKDNPRTKGWAQICDDTGGLSAAAMQVSFSSKNMSHGQAQRVMLRSIEAQAGAQHLVMLDEPEQALDFEGLMLLKGVLAKLASPQIIVATHSPFLMLEPSYHVIEMTPNYLASVRSTLSGLVGGAV